MPTVNDRKVYIGDLSGHWGYPEEGSHQLVPRAEGDQGKFAWRNLQLCDGLEYDIEGVTHVVRRIKE